MIYALWEYYRAGRQDNDRLRKAKHSVANCAIRKAYTRVDPLFGGSFTLLSVALTASVTSRLSSSYSVSRRETGNLVFCTPELCAKLCLHCVSLKRAAIVS